MSEELAKHAIDTIKEIVLHPDVDSVDIDHAIELITYIVKLAHDHAT